MRLTINLEVGSVEEAQSLLARLGSSPAANDKSTKAAEPEKRTEDKKYPPIKAKAKPVVIDVEPEEDLEEEDEPPKKAKANGSGKASTAAEEDDDGSSDDDDDDDQKLPDLSKAQRLRDVLEALIDHGYTDKDELVKICTKLKKTVPALKKIEDIERRVIRAAETLGIE
jgi:hypothetical protein